MDKLLPTHLELSKKAVAIGLLATTALLSACGGHEVASAQPRKHNHSVVLTYEVTTTDVGPVTCAYDQSFTQNARVHIVAEGDTIDDFIKEYSPIGHETMAGGVYLKAPTYDQIVDAIEEHNDVTAESLQIGDAVQLPMFCTGVLPRY